MLGKLYKNSLFLLALIFVFGCSEYSKIVKNDDYDQKLRKAEELYDSKMYNRALVLYEQVYQRHPKDIKGETAYYKLGKAYYNMGDYYMSAYYFSNFPSRFPNSKNVEESLFYSALSSVHNSPDPSLDQEETDIAITELQYFMNRFPNSQRVDTCNLLMDEMRAKIETKALLSVKLYNKMEKYKATVTSAKAFLEDYPQTEYKLEIAFMMLENAYKLAELSVFSRKKERLEDVIEIHDQYREQFQLSKYITPSLLIAEKAGQELEEVDEIVTYEEILDLYKKSQTASKAKKVEFLEETLKLYYTFVQRYPNSSYVKKAEEIYQRAERERQNTYSY